MTTQTKDIATVFGDAYSRSAPKLLKEQHEFLLQALEQHAKSNPNPTLLVVGPGGQVLPYSCRYEENGSLDGSNRDRVKNIIKNGKVVLLDYVKEESRNGLVKGRKTLDSMGFFEKPYFVEGILGIDNVDAERLPESSISFLLNNLRDSLRVKDSSIDAIDANLSVHHASVTRRELKRIYSEFFRVLRNGGMLHLGEGEVDMNYSEDKLTKFGQDLASIVEMPVKLTDEREKAAGYTSDAYFEPNKTYPDLPVREKDFQPRVMHAYAKATEEGMLVIKASAPNQMILDKPTSEGLAIELREKGYKQMLVSNDGVAMPLIDPEIEKDRQWQTTQIDRYYGRVEEKARENYAGIDDHLVEEITRGLRFERGNAGRGTVEYYMGKGRILGALAEVGFRDIKLKKHENSPFYNILAIK